MLKDEDLRKKYDKYGEKGLEDHQQGGGYESWHFYRYDFGKRGVLYLGSRIELLHPAFLVED